jgi:small subunit ribosomal protein S20
MANHSASKKSIRKTIRQNAINTQRRSRIRTFLRKVEEAIEAKDKQKAQEAFKVAQPEIMRGVTKNVFKLNTASRKLSRLSARIKAIA